MSFSQNADTTASDNLFNLSLEDLMNIEIVSAVRQNQNIADAPSVVSVITEKQIKERGYLSIDEAINSIAGFDMITDHFQPNLGIRGINGGMRSWSRLVKVMIDGQNVSFRSSSDNFLDASLIPINAIEKIEIIRGPNSALYGKNAFLGVINIITKSGSNLEKSSIGHYLAHINQNSSFGINTIWGGQKGDVDFIFASSYSQIDKSGLSPKNIPGSQTYTSADQSKYNESHPLSVFMKISYENEKTGKIILDANQQIINSHSDFLDWGSLTHNNTLNFIKSHERISYYKNINELFETSVSLSHSSAEQLHQEILDNDLDPTNWIERDVGYTSFDINGNISYLFDDINNLSFGIDYTTDQHNHQKYYTVNNIGIKTLNPGGTSGPNTFNDLGIYLQMILNPAKFFKLNFIKNLTLTAGYRFDYHNIYEDVLTYRIAAVYNIDNHYSTKLMYGTSFNAPSPTQLYTNYISPGGIVGNPNLKPEKAKTLEWAFLGRVVENVHFNTSIYYTKMDNKIEYVIPYGQISNITALNLSTIYSAGFEMELNANVFNNTGYANYSYQRSILEKTDPLLQDIQIKTSLYPTHIFKFGDVYHIKKFYTNINIEAKYISSRIASNQNNFIYDPIYYTTNRYELDSYFIVDLTISSTNLKIFEKGETKLSFRIQNLLDTEFYYPGFSDFDIPGLGRTYYFSIIQSI